MDIVIDIAPRVDADLVVLEAEQPGVREGYDLLIKWLREDYKVGKPFNFSDADPRNIRSTEVHAMGRAKAGENAAMLVYEVWHDHAIHVQPLGVFRWSDWQRWSHSEREEMIKPRLV